MATNYDDIANTYHTVKLNPIKKYSEEYTVLQHLNNMQGLSILDLACGDGYYTRLFGQAGAKEVIGVDLSPQMIERAHTLDANSSLPVQYQVGDVAQLDLGQTFDLVTAVYLLQYAATKTDLQKMFESVYRHLGANGRFFTVTGNPNLTPAHIAAQQAYGVDISINGDWTDGATIHNVIHTPDGSVEFDNYHWTQQTYEQLLQQIGFRQIQWHTMQIDPVGLERYGAEFWQPYQNYPAIVLLECRC